MSTSAAEGSDTDESMDNLTLAPIQRGGRRSKVWEHFEWELVNVDGDLKGVCKYCQLRMQTKSGTSSLLSHIAVSCPAVPDDVRKSFVSTMKKQPSDGDFVFDPQLSLVRKWLISAFTRRYHSSTLFEDDSTEFNILAWWKNHAEKFPILASMARDFLSITLSMVASESAFRCGGRLLGESRSSLDPEMLETLVCTKDWLYKQ